MMNNKALVVIDIQNDIPSTVGTSSTICSHIHCMVLLAGNYAFITKPQTNERKIQIQHRGTFHPRQQGDCRFLHEDLRFHHRLGWHPTHVEMTLGEMRIILFPRDAFEQMVSRKFQYPEGFNGTVELAFDVPTFADVDKEYLHALSNGAASVLPPTSEPWGQRTCYVADPDGNLIEIGTFTK